MKQKITGGYGEFMKKIMVGLVLGVAWIMPGLSAGVITAATGLYEPIVHALANFPKEYQKSIRLLFPLGLGTGIGLLLFSRALQELLVIAECSVLYLFLGLVAGSIPALFKEANQSGFRKPFFGVALFTFGLVVATGYLLPGLSRTGGGTELNGLASFLSGAILAFGSIVPGISSSLILMYLGFYDQLLAALTGLKLRILALAGAGFVVIALLMLKLVDYVFRKYRSFAYYGVVGVLFGFMVLTFPGFRPGVALVLDLVLFAAGATLSFGMAYLSAKQQQTPSPQ
ncbi:MAG: DUF368 domain-containing protein [Firmicutes bacterium]|nr:DUF368 domain-containing protein [Bacillota bacterium]